MTDLVYDGAYWLATQLWRLAAKEVEYHRGSVIVPVRAVLGRTRLKLIDPHGGVRYEWTDRDFLIRAADFVPVLTAPRRGDIVHELDGSTTLAFEVAPYGDEPPWRWADAHRLMLRIHCKRIA